MVLPQPDGPKTDNNSPFFKVKLMSFSASTFTPVCAFEKVIHKFLQIRSDIIFFELLKESKTQLEPYLKYLQNYFLVKK